MILLALETSTPHASLALWRDGEVVREWGFHSDRAHNSLIFAPLAEALELAQPDLIAVGTGPGSYAGVRVALAAALGVAMAKNIPLLGWPSLTAFDILCDGCVIGDARRGGFYIAQIAGTRLVGAPAIVDAEELARLTHGMMVWTFDDTPWVPEALPVKPSAAWLARRVAALQASERTALASISPEPIYLRAPFITAPRPVVRARQPVAGDP